MNKRQYSGIGTFGIYLRDIGRYEVPTRERERELAIRASKGDIDAKNELVSSNLRLVIRMAKKLSVDDNLEDLIQEGSMGLMHAVDKFEYQRGWRFSTYACWWIGQRMKKYIQADSTIRLPVCKMELIGKVNRLVRDYIRSFGDEPSIEYIASELRETKGFSDQKIENVMRAHRLLKTLPLDILSEDADESFERSEYSVYHNRSSIYEDESAEDKVCSKQMGAYIREIIRCLKPKDQAVLKLRFGIGNDDNKTLEQIGAVFCLTRERIRQIEKNALLKLRSLILNDLRSKEDRLVIFGGKQKQRI